MMQVPFARPSFSGTETAAVAAVIESGWVSQGPRVSEFETAFAARVGAPEAVATTSCTTALALALYVSRVGPGDEVIVPSLSFIATANAVWQCGATPVFADIDPRTYNLDPVAAERAISPRTRVIMPVHQLGLPAEMDDFLALGAAYGVSIVEDAACAIGATYKGRPVGALSPLACFSFHPRKVITTGEGGMISVEDPAVAARIRRLRQHGMDTSDLARHAAKDVVLETYPERGWNARMTDMQAAMGLCQLEALDGILDRRRRVAERYTEAIEQMPYLEPPYDPPHTNRTWQSYCVRVREGSPVRRTELMRLLLEDGIPTRRGVMAIHEEVSYACAAVNLRHTENATRDTLMLPLFADLTEKEQEYVIERLAKHTSYHAIAPARARRGLQTSAAKPAPMPARTRKPAECSEAT
jgi:dTDP-4-amino-4,6-dideoxygalactose transaminase